jgi:hypothetical protein
MNKPSDPGDGTAGTEATPADGGVRPPRPRDPGARAAKFVALSGRLNRGEITREQFEQLMGDDMQGVIWIDDRSDHVDRS